MKKKLLAKSSWKIVIVLVSVLFLGSIAGLVWSYSMPLEVAEEYKVYSYSQEGAVDYQVHLVENSLFAETVLEAGRGYITELTDYIATDFTYRFSGNGQASFSGEYGMVAMVTAYTGRDGHKVFETSDELLLPQSFSVTGRDLYIEESVNIPLQEYLQIAGRLREEARFSPDDLTLIVKYNLNVTANTEHGMVREQFEPVMEIPLKGSTFVIGGELKEEKSDGITASRSVAAPIVEKARKVFSVGTICLAVMLLIILLLTAPKEMKVNRQEREVALILKKHGDRIAVSTAGVPEAGSNTVLVGSFQDIEKIADELGKPILYHQSKTDPVCRHSFFVLSEERDYMYYVEVRPVPAPVVGARQELRASARKGG